MSGAMSRSAVVEMMERTADLLECNVSPHLVLEAMMLSWPAVAVAAHEAAR
jgi:hypothetical protein